MHFVDQVNFVTAFRRRITNVVTQLAHIVDAVVAGAIDFNHVKTVARSNLAAVIANAAWRDGRSFYAVERFCQNARRRCFADPARSNKQVRMCEPVLRDGVFQRARDVRLSDQIVKSLRPVFSRENLVAHAFNLNALLRSRK